MFTRLRVGTSLGVSVIALAWLGLGTARGIAQFPTGTGIPPNATALEGLPQVRIVTTKDTATREELSATESVQSRLVIKIIDGDLYWGAREGRPLTVTTSGDFTYLSWTEPGQYVRFRRLGDRLIYAEHVDMPLGSVTYWGELRVVLKK